MLRRPDGSFLRTVIRGFEMVNIRPRPASFHAPISLPPPLTKNDVPVGTIVTVLQPPAKADDVFLFEVASSCSSEEGVVLSGAVQQVAPGTRIVLVRPDDTTCGTRVLSSSAGQLMVSPAEVPKGTLVFAAAR